LDADEPVSGKKKKVTTVFSQKRGENPGPDLLSGEQESAKAWTLPSGSTERRDAAQLLTRAKRGSYDANREGGKGSGHYTGRGERIQNRQSQ